MEPTNQTTPNNKNDGLRIANDDKPANPADSLLIPDKPKPRLYTYRGGVHYGIPPEERENWLGWS